MGKKVNPLAMRPVHKYSVWFTTNKKLFGDYINIDNQIRVLADQVLNRMNFACVGIERVGMQTNITIYTHKPGVLVGNRDNKTPLIEVFKQKLKDRILKNTEFVVLINDQDLKMDSSAILIAKHLANSVANNMNYKSISKKTIARFMQNNPNGGIRIVWHGRINKVEIARTEKFQSGKMPQSKLKEIIDFAYDVAHTSVGTVTVRVYIYIPHGEKATSLQDNWKDKKRPFRPENNRGEKRSFDNNKYNRAEKAGKTLVDASLKENKEIII